MKLPRLKLRTSILLVALVAGLLGFGASLRSRALERMEAIARIDRMHGTYGVKINGPAWSREVMKRFGVDESAFYAPTRINFGPHNMGADREVPFRDGDLASMASTLARYSDTLRELDLQESRVTDRGIADLPPLPNLKLLALDGTRVTDDVIPYLGRFPALVEVSLVGTDVTRAGLREIRRRYPGCKVKAPDLSPAKPSRAGKPAGSNR